MHLLGTLLLSLRGEWRSSWRRVRIGRHELIVVISINGCAKGWDVGANGSGKARRNGTVGTWRLVICIYLDFQMQIIVF